MPPYSYHGGISKATAKTSKDQQRLAQEHRQQGHQEAIRSIAKLLQQLPYTGIK